MSLSVASGSLRRRSLKETIGKSEMYASKSSMENGIKSVATNAPMAKIVDRTA